jgi:hypothetical protein
MSWLCTIRTAQKGRSALLHDLSALENCIDRYQCQFSIWLIIVVVDDVDFSISFDPDFDNVGTSVMNSYGKLGPTSMWLVLMLICLIFDIGQQPSD